MSITPSNNLFTALSLTDIAKQAPRPAARAQNQIPGQAQEKLGSVHKEEFAKVAERHQERRQQDIGQQQQSKATAASSTEITEDKRDQRQQVAADFRREAVGTPRPQFQKLGQLVDLSI